MIVVQIVLYMFSGLLELELELEQSISISIIPSV